MVIPGPLDVILDVDEFIFGFCSMKCNGDFLVCYEPDSSGENVLDSCDTKFGFYITTLDDTTSFMEPISSENFGIGKSDQCFEVKMTNGITSVLSSEGDIASPETYAPKVENGIAKLNIINATSECSVKTYAPKVENGIAKLNIMNTISECSVSGKNAIIKPETTTAPPTITRLGKLGRTSSGKNGHASAATTDEPGSFFDDYWWIFSIFGLILIAIGIGVGVYCYLRSKKKSQKPIPTRQRKLLESQSPVVSKETQKGKTESAQKGKTEKRKIYAIIKNEPTIAPPTTPLLEQLDQTSSGKNGHASAATTNEPESFIANYWWIFSILGLTIIAFGVGVGVYCYLRRKKKAQKPVPARRRKLQESKSTVVLKPSTETQNGNNESAVRPDSLYNQSSILSHKSLLLSKKEPNKEAPEETDLTSMKPTA
uniref:Uncharacterized protein n=1 Tax=Panagrolaimus sp. PS1159 TaxID=55785 RepID=A0AC35F5V9_9BILA